MKVLFTHLSSDDELLRILPHLRAAKKAVAKNAIRVHGFLQRVEQDALHLPFRVQTLAGELRDIWLVHAIDVATSLVVGWALSVGPPTTAVSLACVESILYSKKARLSAMDVHFDADPYGAPTCLVFDNGSEAKNERISSLTSLGIEVSYCKSHHPHHKPFIERLNRALKEALETLPGCTRMDGKDGRRDPTALGDRLMSMEELERWIARFYYEDWANRPLDRLVRADFAEASDLGATPLARFLRMERDGAAMPMPPNLDDWRRVKFTSEKRTLARTTGITVESFHFRGQNLDRLINRFGETEVEVFVDPDDFRTVYVVNGEELVPLVNADVDEGTPVLSFSAAKAKEKAAKEVAKAAGSVIRERFRKDIFAASLEAPLRAAKRNSTSASKSVRNETKHLQAVEQARQRPLAAEAVADEASVTSDFSLEQFDALPIIDRRTGEAL
ncbi:transposase family protein [Variovorax sp. N23]|nr:transposase family protein [Variovorax sp. N23]